MKSFNTLFLLIVSLQLSAQIRDSTNNLLLSTVTVTAYKEGQIKQSSLNIIPIRIDSLSRYNNFNLTDLIAKTPGVSVLSTGVAIAKPVIRGLYGNRILVLLSGLKFDNQQWQEEHGMGLSDLGLSKVELIKGPMSVLYGTEAIGGIINLIEEEKAPLNTSETDVALKLNSNTLGGLLQAGYKANNGKSWYRIRLGIENNADYSDGNGKRILNSRFDGYYLKASYGFQKHNWTSENSFSSSYNRFGFIFNDIYNFLLPDSRWSRDLSTNPAHLVFLNILSSENKIDLADGSRFVLNLGVQSNQRLEKEGGGGISLNMQLLTFQYLAKWIKKLSERNGLIISNLGSYEDNSNYGSRKIIPDARMQESNISAYLSTDLGNRFILENGIGAGEKWIKTYFTPSVNDQNKEIHPFSKLSPYFNAFSGFSYIPSQSFNFKFNIATGVRIPNLAELSSDGLHEGVFTYEIGDPNLKNEQNLELNLTANYTSKQLELWVSPFYNHFFNFVYLSPTNEEWFGFPIYRFKQQDASQYGIEAGLKYKPINRMAFGVVYSGMVAKTKDENNLPYTPAQKLSSSIHYNFVLANHKSLNCFVELDYYLAQNNTAPFEIATPNYKLVNLGTSTSFNLNNHNCDISVTVSNLLNEAYYDHLSRFKNYGLLNIGRNITLSFKMNIESSKQRSE